MQTTSIINSEKSTEEVDLFLEGYILLENIYEHLKLGVIFGDPFRLEACRGQREKAKKRIKTWHIKFWPSVHPEAEITTAKEELSDTKTAQINEARENLKQVEKLFSIIEQNAIDRKIPYFINPNSEKAYKYHLDKIRVSRKELGVEGNKVAAVDKQIKELQIKADYDVNRLNVLYKQIVVSNTVASIYTAKETTLPILSIEESTYKEDYASYDKNDLHDEIIPDRTEFYICPTGGVYEWDKVKRKWALDRRSIDFVKVADCLDTAGKSGYLGPETFNGNVQYKEFVNIDDTMFAGVITNIRHGENVRIVTSWEPSNSESKHYLRVLERHDNKGQVYNALYKTLFSNSLIDNFLIEDSLTSI